MNLLLLLASFAFANPQCQDQAFRRNVIRSRSMADNVATAEAVRSQYQAEKGKAHTPLATMSEPLTSA